MQHPKLHTRVFHTDYRLYTMLLVNLGKTEKIVSQLNLSPFIFFAQMSVTQFSLVKSKHNPMTRPNISLSALSPSRISDPNSHTYYIPPHPQRGSPYHRYVCLLPQPPLESSGYILTGAYRATTITSVELDIPIVLDQERLGFNIRKFTSQWNLDGTKGGGVHMWREVWDDDVSHIYKDILGKLFFLLFSTLDGAFSFFFNRYGRTCV